MSVGMGTELQYKKSSVLLVTHFWKSSFPPPTPCLRPAAHFSLSLLLLWCSSLLQLYGMRSHCLCGSKKEWKPLAGTPRFTMTKQTYYSLSMQKIAYHLTSFIKDTVLMEPCLPSFECPWNNSSSRTAEQHGASYIFNHLYPIGIAVCQQGQLLPLCSTGELKDGKLWFQKGVLQLLMS